jgi:hypothetical protein
MIQECVWIRVRLFTSRTMLSTLQNSIAYYLEIISADQSRSRSDCGDL